MDLVHALTSGVPHVVLAEELRCVEGPLATRRESGGQQLEGRTGLLVNGLLRMSVPGSRDSDLPERVIHDALVTQHVDVDLPALALEERDELGGLLENVVVVTATHASVGGDNEYRGTLGVLGFVEHPVFDRRRVGEVGEDRRDLIRERLGLSDPRLRLGDLRSRDQFLGLGDLLGRVDGLDPVAQFTQIRHGLRSHSSRP